MEKLLDMVETLLEHPRRNHAFFDPQANRFVVYHPTVPGGPAVLPLTYPGIRERMKKAFFPEFVYDEKAKNSNDATQSCLETLYVLKKKTNPRPDPKNRDEYEKWLKEDAAPRGLEGGTMVHSQVEAMVNGIDLSITYQKDHPWFKVIKEGLKEAGYVPVISEYIIYDEYQGWATKVDLIAIDVKLGEFVGLELKTGSATNFCANQGEMLGPPSVLLPNCSLKNQAMLQILLPCLTFNEHYQISIRPEVWHICDEGLQRYALSNELLNFKVRDTLYRGCVMHVMKMGLKTPVEIASEKRKANCVGEPVKKPKKKRKTQNKKK